MATRECPQSDPSPRADRRGQEGRPIAVLGGAERVLRDPSARGAADPAPIENGVALVSGGHRGLGLAIVRALAELGMRVVMAIPSPDHGRAALDWLGDLADRVAVRQLDVTDQLSVDRLVATMERQLGGCDALMNNVALLVDGEETALDIDLDVVRRTLEANLLGTWRLTQAIAPLMRRNGHGRIVNITSQLGSLRTMASGLPAYRVSQIAINGLTRILAADLAGDGILVNACCPGAPELTRADPRETIEFSGSADTAAWLATLPDDGPTGGFFRNRKPIEW